MLRSTIVMLALTGCVAAPAPETDGDLSTLTRDEARAMAGKGDHGLDLCEWLGWYGDGICDEFCAHPDPDCDAQCRSDADCPQPYCLPGGPCPRFECVDGECVRADRHTSCGGFAGLTCPDGQFCDFADDSCGWADAMGTCTDVPDAWIEIYAPVCGCDGVTYGNTGEAHGNGVDVAHDGACEPPPPPPTDCRADGCGAGRYCSWCWGSWACIPDGALC